MPRTRLGVDLVSRIQNVRLRFITIIMPLCLRSTMKKLVSSIGTVFLTVAAVVFCLAS